MDSKLFALLLASFLCLPTTSIADAKLSSVEVYQLPNEVKIALDQLQEVQFYGNFELPELEKWNSWDVQVKTNSPGCQANIVNIYKSDSSDAIEDMRVDTILTTPSKFKILVNCSQKSQFIRAYLVITMHHYEFDTVHNTAKGSQAIWVSDISRIGGQKIIPSTSWREQRQRIHFGD